MPDLLTNLQAVKDYLKITNPNSDAVLSRLIPAASAHFLTRTNRAGLITNTYNESRNTLGSGDLQLLNYPVLSIQSLMIGRITLKAATSSHGGYRFTALGLLTFGGAGGGISNGPGYFCGSGIAQIAYTAGYANIDQVNELQTVPAVATGGLFTLTPLQPMPQVDDGVNVFVGGAALTPVFGIAPGAGQYAFLNGQYIFNAAQAGVAVLLNYAYSGVPSDVQQAVTEIASTLYKGRDHVGVSSIGVGPERTSYSMKFSDATMRTISDYTRRFSIPGFVL